MSSPTNSPPPKKRNTTKDSTPQKTQHVAKPVAKISQNPTDSAAPGSSYISTSSVTSNGHGLPPPNNNTACSKATSSSNNRHVPASQRMTSGESSPTTSASSGCTSSSRNSKRRPGLIAVFSAKGGVGKTTTAINIASAMTLEGKRVLLIDADAQCNLTNALRHPQLDAQNDVPLNVQDEPVEFPAVQPGNKVIIDGVSAATVDWRNYMNDPAAVNLFNLLLPAMMGDAQGMTPPDLQNFNVFNNAWLIPGSPHLTRFEQDIASANSSALVTFGCFRALALETAEKYQCDFVIADFGPFFGLMNRTFIMSCDYILPNVFPDSFSLQSVDTLLVTVLPNWHDIQNQITFNEPPVVNATLERFRYPRVPPRILPFLISGYKIPRMNVRLLDNAASRWANAITNYVAENRPRANDNPVVAKTRIQQRVSSTFFSLPCELELDRRDMGDLQVIPILRHIRSLIDRAADQHNSPLLTDVNQANATVRSFKNHCRTRFRSWVRAFSLRHSQANP